MKRTISLILALLTLCALPACSRQPKEEPYHWIPPEKKVGQTVTDDGYDPSSGMTYEEYLCTLDSPIVISFEGIRNTKPLLDLTDSISSSLFSTVKNAPHVTDISFPTLLHWLDNFCGEQIMQFSKDGSETLVILRKNVQFARMEKATLMIGQNQTALKEEQIGEGRKWNTMQECCVNRALYEKLISYEKAEFTGLGDTIYVTESFFNRSIMRDTQEEAISSLFIPSKTIHEYTVVGIMEDEGEYANAEAYGFFHIYASIDMVKNLISKHDGDHPFYVDEAMYLLTNKTKQYSDRGTTWLFTRPSPEDSTKMEIRLPGNQIISEEEWLAQFENMPVNAGYTMEVTLDSGKGFAEFLEYFQTMNKEYTARYYYEGSFTLYERNKASHPDDPTIRLNIPPLVQEIADADELDEWYYYPLTPRVIRPLRVAGG